MFAVLHMCYVATYAYVNSMALYFENIWYFYPCKVGCRYYGASGHVPVCRVLGVCGVLRPRIIIPVHYVVFASV